MLKIRLGRYYLICYSDIEKISLSKYLTLFSVQRAYLSNPKTGNTTANHVEAAHGGAARGGGAG